MSGKISDAIERTLSGIKPELVDHRLRDQRDAVFGATEALGVEHRVLADDETVGNPTSGSMTTLFRLHIPSNPNVGNDDGLMDSGERMDAAPVKTSEREIDEPETMQPPEISEETATPRRPSTSCTNWPAA